MVIDGLEVAAILIGGFWALYLYRTRRRGQAIVIIQPRSRVHHDSHSGRRVLLIALRIVNSSGVLFRYARATATLMDASDRLTNGGVSLLPFAEQDPFLSVYGDRVDDQARVLKGELFEMRQEVVLEPDESVDTELAFPLTEERSGLLAMRVLIQGYQRRDKRHPWIWSSFFYIDPLGPGRGSS